ncbi:DUF418 domain-containing protein [Corynebacterium sp. HMSC074A01]|uniref:DUF418 domain-containing protein n=1 Tax=Corynebacterium sp. HMSC074A01 TaxID=1715030 RepID=UPI0008A588C6|nr:DUF418 domain-containing protein [Corynebacterium sp. HMSC074A01]OHF41763.1 hypothetical protein HMPREF2550_00195 [Corynebacterium sp. HMSC074A01]
MQRLIVPDLARGTALLGIALANGSLIWMVNDASQPGSAPGWTLGGVAEGSLIDAALALFAALFVHTRGLPMFATLLGFGFGLVVASLYRKDYPAAQARRVLARRYGALALFGLAHMVLLFYGDIMTMYGFVGLILAAMFALSTKVLRIIAYTCLGIYVLLTSLIGVTSLFLPEFAHEMAESSIPTMNAEATTFGAYFADNLGGAGEMLISTPFILLELVPLAAIGYVWAKEGVLVNPQAHRRTLWTWTFITAAIILCVGLPWGLSAIGVLNPELEVGLFLLNTAVGSLTGPGILAALALATAHLHNATPKWTYPLVALGKRSMSGYLAQTFFFLALVYPFSLGLGQDWTVSGKLALSAGVWLATVLIATALEAAGKQGPFEWAHRHVSYGKTGRIEPHRDRAEIAG